MEFSMNVFRKIKNDDKTKNVKNVKKRGRKKTIKKRFYIYDTNYLQAKAILYWRLQGYCNMLRAQYLENRDK